MCTVNRYFACFSFKQFVQCICNAIDRQDAAVSEEFYDNLVTCDIKSVDCIIGALLVEQTAVQRLKGDVIIYQVCNCLCLVLVDLAGYGNQLSCL